MACASEVPAFPGRCLRPFPVALRFQDFSEPPALPRRSRMRPSASPFMFLFLRNMPHPARYVRPKRPSRGVVLQERDLAVLEAVRRYRALRAEHLAALVGPVGRRVLQARLRLLWEHRLLERRYLPATWGGVSPPVASLSPLYLSTPRGARRLSEARGSPHREERLEPPSVFTLAHDLAATDFLVALEAAARATDVSVRAEPEHSLRRRLAETAARPGDGKNFIVPDGAAAISPGSSEPATIHLEIVRAGTRSGNASLVRKLLRYGELLRDGFFLRAYGHARIRAVLIATTSERRAETFRELAQAQLPRSAQWLFWFGAFHDLGASRATFRPETVLAALWKRTDGRDAALGPLLAAPRASSSSAPPP